MYLSISNPLTPHSHKCIYVFDVCTPDRLNHFFSSLPPRLSDCLLQALAYTCRSLAEAFCRQQRLRSLLW